MSWLLALVGIERTLAGAASSACSAARRGGAVLQAHEAAVQAGVAADEKGRQAAAQARIHDARDAAFRGDPERHQRRLQLIERHRHRLAVEVAAVHDAFLLDEDERVVAHGVQLDLDDGVGGGNRVEHRAEDLRDAAHRVGILPRGDGVAPDERAAVASAPRAVPRRARWPPCGRAACRAGSSASPCPPSASKSIAAAVCAASATRCAAATTQRRRAGVERGAVDQRQALAQLGDEGNEAERRAARRRPASPVRRARPRPRRAPPARSRQARPGRRWRRRRRSRARSGGRRR